MGEKGMESRRGKGKEGKEGDEVEREMRGESHVLLFCQLENCDRVKSKA